MQTWQPNQTHYQWKDCPETESKVSTGASLLIRKTSTKQSSFEFSEFQKWSGQISIAKIGEEFVRDFQAGI